MTPFKLAAPTKESQERIVTDMVAKWIAGDETVRAFFKDCITKEAVEKAAWKFNDKTRKENTLWINDRFQVAMREIPEAGMVHLSIKRIDREIIHDWRELQEIKNILVGEECEGVELYPAESRRVDCANSYHVFCLRNPQARFPFGFTGGRFVSEDSIGGSRQRPFERNGNDSGTIQD